MTDTPEDLVRRLLNADPNVEKSPFTLLYETAYAFEAMAAENGRLREALGERSQNLLRPVIVHQFRKHRADVLTAHIMQIVDKYLRDEGREHRDCSRELLDVFYDSGAEVITDADRAIAGLSPRNEQGLTAQELQLLEMHRLQVMMRPLEHFLPLSSPAPKGMAGGDEVVP